VPQLLDRYPKLQLEISNADHQMDIIAEGFDCVIRVGVIKDSSLIARPLATLDVLNCVSPAYVRRFGEPGSLDELPNHRLIRYVQTLGSGPDGFEYVRDGQTQVIAMPGVITVKGTESYLAACLSGLGIAQIPAMGVRDYIEQGKLINVLPEYPAEPMPAFIVYPSRLNPPRRVRVFMEWLEEEVRAWVSG
jgi:DNA-binding transcriptional LysR family regulator